jgi:hypothetical protein
MPNTPIAQHIQKLQGWRVPRDRSKPLSEAIGHLQNNALRAQRQLGSFIDAWDQLVPESVSRHTMVEAKRGGTIHVNARSASVAFELDRQLREGLLAELRTACRGSIANIRVRVGPIEPAARTTR